MDHYPKLLVNRCDHFICFDDVEQHRVERETMILCLRRNIIDKWTSAHITEFRRMQKGMMEKILPACAALQRTPDERSLLASTSYLIVQGVRGQEGAPWAADYVHAAITSSSMPIVGTLNFFVHMANAAATVDFNLCHPEGRHHLFTGLAFLKANASGQSANKAFLAAAKGLVPLFRRIMFGASDPVPDSLVVSSVQACTNIAIGFSARARNGLVTSRKYYAQSFARCALLLLYNTRPEQYQPIGEKAYACFAERQSGAVHGRSRPARGKRPTSPVACEASSFEVAKSTGVTSSAALEALVQCMAEVGRAGCHLPPHVTLNPCTCIEAFVVLCEYKQLRKRHSVECLRDLAAHASDAQIRHILMSMETKGPKLCHAQHIVAGLLALQKSTAAHVHGVDDAIVIVDSSDEESSIVKQEAGQSKKKEGSQNVGRKTTKEDLPAKKQKNPTKANARRKKKVVQRKEGSTVQLKKGQILKQAFETSKKQRT